ncbi:protein vreteno isoform X1 [Culex pipiens pallens]|uniref:protein vreteno isoform X1 n=1 Tax=Culex pipiens pallens TaxID=42434 RepID=UPI0022A9FFA4|nr:protein vreteno isoform X1 [Culex pipiens pallens]
MVSKGDALDLAALDAELDQMSKDYCDPELNRYDTGPGADLDDRQQPGALAAAAAAAGGGSEMGFSEPPAVRIRLKNTRDLTEAGLRELCRPYGTIVNVYKAKQEGGNFAFVEFGNPSEAGLAIQELNAKLGFQFYAAFAHEKKDTDLVPMPPPPFGAGSGEKVVHSIETLGPDEESWERTVAQRRVKTAFSIPLRVRFPEEQGLATAPHYRAEGDRLTQLSRVDAGEIFSVVTLIGGGGKLEVDKGIDVGIVQLIDKLAQRESVSRLTLVEDGDRKKPVYHFSSLPADQSKLFPDSSCVACGHRGFFSCSICTATYCSRHCQAEDYGKHKDSCHIQGVKVRVPAPSAVFEDLDEDGLTQEAFKKGSHVMILAVLSPERVFVRSLDKESNKEYLQTLSDVAKAGLTAQPLKNVPVAGAICLAFYEPLQIYARVLITKVAKGQASCVFIEFGLIQLVPVKQLKQLNDSALKLRKVRVHKVHLHGITTEYGHIEKAIDYLKTLINQPLEMKAQTECGNLVDAQLRTAYGVSVNKRINELITIPIEKALDNVDAFVNYNSIPAKRLPPNQTLDILILNRTTVKLDFRVGLIAYSDLPYLHDLHRKLQSYGKKVEKFTENFTPRLHEVCLVRDMSTWYRGVCIEAAGDCRPTIYLCDYGCMIMVKLQDIRKIPPSLALEVRTTDAKVYGLEEAKNNGLKIDSEFLDIYLEENERLTVETSEEVEFSEFEMELSRESQSMMTVIKVPELVAFIEEREQRERNRVEQPLRLSSRMSSSTTTTVSSKE